MLSRVRRNYKNFFLTGILNWLEIFLNPKFFLLGFRLFGQTRFSVNDNVVPAMIRVIRNSPLQKDCEKKCSEIIYKFSSKTFAMNLFFQ